MRYFYIMLELFRKYRFFIWMQGPLIFGFLLNHNNKPLAQKLPYYIMWELLIIGIFLKYRYDLANQHRILQVHNGKLLVRGVWGRKEIPIDEILSLEVRRAFVARVFDWSQVIVQTKMGKVNIYTQRIVAVPKLDL